MVSLLLVFSPVTSTKLEEYPPSVSLIVTSPASEPRTELTRRPAEPRSPAAPWSRPTSSSNSGPRGLHGRSHGCDLARRDPSDRLPCRESPDIGGFRTSSGPLRFVQITGMAEYLDEIDGPKRHTRSRVARQLWPSCRIGIANFAAGNLVSVGSLVGDLDRNLCQHILETTRRRGVQLLGRATQSFAPQQPGGHNVERRIRPVLLGHIRSPCHPCHRPVGRRRPLASPAVQPPSPR